MILVDTSVLISFLKGEDDQAPRILAYLVSSGEPFEIPTICAQEVLQGARTEAEYRKLKTYLWSQDLCNPKNPSRTHESAARIYFDARRKGISIRSSVDCFIAALALERNAVLLHQDRDFQKIQKVRPLRFVTSAQI